jgi:hypothetical protein
LLYLLVNFRVSYRKARKKLANAPPLGWRSNWRKRILG